MSHPVYCKHDRIEIDVAVDADGFCPLCQAAEIDRLRAELAAKDARIAEVHAQAERLGSIATNQAEVIETLRKQVAERDANELSLR